MCYYERSTSTSRPRRARFERRTLCARPRFAVSADAAEPEQRPSAGSWRHSNHRLGGASDSARIRLRESHESGVVDVFLWFIRNQDAPAAWDHVWKTARKSKQQDWPWMWTASRGLAITSRPFGIIRRPTR